MNEILEIIKEKLDLFPEVKWDRYTKVKMAYSIFGWILREDKRFDYMILDLDFAKLEKKGYYTKSLATSSAKYSAEFAKRLGVKHFDCQRVEDLLPDYPNVIKLMSQNGGYTK